LTVQSLLSSGATSRYLSATLLGLRIYASYKAYSIKQKLTGHNDDQALSELHQKNARAILTHCIKLRGFFIKMAQFIAARKDLLPPEYVQVLTKLHDDVPPAPFRAIVEEIETALGKPLHSAFSEFDATPVAAASLAQVHRAITHDGKEVAIKVQTPGIRQLLDGDLSFLKALGILIKKYMAKQHWETLLTDVANAISAELDFDNELKNINLFIEAYGNSKSVIIPQPEKSMCTQTVLTMSFIHGQKISDYLKHAKEEGNAKGINHVFSTLIGAYCQQILALGFFHADPHPGNLLITPDNKLAILDFGSVQQNSPDITQAYIQLLFAILSKNKEKAVSIFTELGFKTRDGQLDTLMEAADLFMKIFQKEVDGSTINPKQRIEELLQLLKSNPLISLPYHFVMLAKVISTIAGLYFYFRPNVNLFAVIGPHMAAAARPKSQAS